MPMNEAKGFARSNLTPKQRAESHAAIYGLQKDKHMQNSTADLGRFSASEIERMKAILAAHEGKQHVGIREFDLNNPPKEPYTHQEFPRLVYHHDKRTHRLAHSHEDLEAALEAGWLKEPYPADAPKAAVEFDPEIAAELEAIEAKLRAAKAKRK